MIAKAAAAQASSSSGGFPVGSMYAEHGAGLTDSPVYPKQQSLTLSWMLCNSIPASTVTVTTSWTSGLNFTVLYLLPCLLKVHGALPFSPAPCVPLLLAYQSERLQISEHRRRNRKDVKTWLQQPEKSFEDASYGSNQVPTNVIGEAPTDFSGNWTRTERSIQYTERANYRTAKSQSQLLLQKQKHPSI